MKESTTDCSSVRLPFWLLLWNKLQRRLMRVFDVFLLCLVALVLVTMWPLIKGDDDDKLT